MVEVGVYGHLARHHVLYLIYLQAGRYHDAELRSIEFGHYDDDYYLA
jgi:hypothetical protein